MTVLAHLGTGVFAPIQLIGVTVFGAAYALRATTLRQAGRSVPRWRMISYFAGLAVILAAFVSPLDHLGGELVLAHMVQHLLIGDIAALLIVLGLTRAIIQPILAIALFDRMRFLALPMVALPLWALNLYAWHLPVLYEGAVNHDAIHALQHTCFIGFGVLMWMPVFGPLPMPTWFSGGAQLAYTLVARLAGAGLGNILMWSGTQFYPVYTPGERYWNVAPLTDQGIAGVTMMAEGGVVFFALLAYVLFRWSDRDAETQRLLELAAQRGVALDPERAGRAVAAGQGARLEERIRA